jgi:hypothetical protein
MNILDALFNGMGGSEMYRELFPHQPPMLIHNWSVTDREMYCGGRSA